MSEKTTKKAAPDSGEGDLLPEYRFDYSKAKPNRFAALANAEALTVVIEPDVAEVFRTPEAVNKALRALIEAMPGPSRSEGAGSGSD